MTDTPPLTATAPAADDSFYSRTHVMLDLETWGVGPGAAIASIGAVKFRFDQMDEPPESEFFEAISPKSCVDAGLEIQSGTLTWWLTRQPLTLSRFLQENRDTWLSAHEAIKRFLNWVGEDAVVFANGPSFDHGILAHAARRVSIKPLPYWRERCHRTALDMLNPPWMSRSVAKAHLKEKLGPVAHDGLADAKRQAAELQVFYRMVTPSPSAKA